MYSRGQERKVKGLRAKAGGKDEKEHEKKEEKKRKTERQMGDQVKRTFAERPG